MVPQKLQCCERVSHLAAVQCKITTKRAEKDGNKHLLLNFERVKYWLALGAQPSDTVARIFGQVGIIPQPPLRPILPKATKNKDKRRSTAEKADA